MQGHGLLFPMPPFLDSWGNWVQEPGCARTSVLGHEGIEPIEGGPEHDLIGGTCARVHEGGHHTCPKEGAHEHHNRCEGLCQEVEGRKWKVSGRWGSGWLGSGRWGK